MVMQFSAISCFNLQKSNGKYYEGLDGGGGGGGGVWYSLFIKNLAHYSSH